MVSGGITKDGMSKSKVDPCGVCSMRGKANSAQCVQFGKQMCQSEKGDAKVCMKSCLLEM